MNQFRFFPQWILLAVLCLVWTSHRAASAETKWVYFGTYTGPKSKGIYVSRFNSATGELSPAELAAEVGSPSFLDIHPNKKVLYAVTESADFGGERTGAVSAFAIDSTTGKLRLLNNQPSAGAGPCHVTVDRTGRAVLVANYGGGSIASFPVEADGQLGKAGSMIQHKGTSVNPRRQEAPHAHCINLDPGNRFALVADLGLDQVLVYKFNPAKAALEANNPPAANLAPGSGPRHVTFDPRGRRLYVINELTCTVAAFNFQPDQGKLDLIQTISTLPAELKSGYSTAEIEMHPSGKFLYGSNRGHDSIVVYKVDPDSGRLTLVEHKPTGGRTPRNFGIDPGGKYLLAANQGSDTVLVFKIDSQSGKLTQSGPSVAVPSPVCVKFL